jgi:uroporphyrin-3 C-methyltransferase
VNELPEATPATSPTPAPAATPAPAVGRAGLWFWRLLGLACAALAAGAAWFALTAQQRVHELEAELVKRQQTSADQAMEARAAARQAQEQAREAAAKVTLLDERVAGALLQRSQIEDLMQSVARSRDENVLADVEAALRVAMQQTLITGSAEPLVAALRQAGERLARDNQPQLERVRRAIASDLERVKAAGVTDIADLAARLDDTVRLADTLPLLARPEPRPHARAAARPARAASAPEGAASAPGWSERWADRWRAVGASAWAEVRSLVRLTPIDQPEAMLIAPEQAYFLRENLKLRLLNARLALLSRQFDTAQSDLRDVRAALERYFDMSARSVQAADAQVKQVMAKTRLVGVPRPDATLAAIAAASAGR